MISDKIPEKMKTIHVELVLFWLKKGGLLLGGGGFYSGKYGSLLRLSHSGSVTKNAGLDTLTFIHVRSIQM